MKRNRSFAILLSLVIFGIGVALAYSRHRAGQNLEALWIAAGAFVIALVVSSAIQVLQHGGIGPLRLPSADLVLGHTSTPSKLAPTVIGPNISPGWRDAGLGNPHFEAPTTPSCSVLLWRGGFENAGAEIAKIIPWLDSRGI